jgi:VIT1/CCC1 family predicted Fe2+/Mn2+ transporter
MIILIPFILSYFHLIDLYIASWTSIVLSLTILFITGTYLGQVGKKNPLIKGFRMVIFGIIAFIIGYFIRILI